ncbi:hypothetical protein ABIA40_000357 [Bradyrhizobium sp. USDA 223]
MIRTSNTLVASTIVRARAPAAQKGVQIRRSGVRSASSRLKSIWLWRLGLPDPLLPNSRSSRRCATAVAAHREARSRGRDGRYRLGFRYFVICDRLKSRPTRRSEGLRGHKASAEQASLRRTSPDRMLLLETHAVQPCRHAIQESRAKSLRRRCYRGNSALVEDNCPHSLGLARKASTLFIFAVCISVAR